MRAVLIEPVPTASCSARPAPFAVPARPRPTFFSRAGRRPLALPCRAYTEAPQRAAPPPAITLSEKALAHLVKLRAESGGEQVVLRMGVRSGGCSGLSYHMDFEKVENIKPEDSVMDYEGGAFKLVCDAKSLLYLFGMRLDYSDALIGGGFQFHNPNAESSCGCGKSFGV